MHGEFCTALNTDDIVALLTADATGLSRAQGNEATSAKPELRLA